MDKKSIEAAIDAGLDVWQCGKSIDDGIRAAIAAYRDAEIERLTAENEQLRDSLKHKWQEGQPPKWFDEWFIARTSFGDRCVLKRLPEEYTYQYTTADGTYFMAEKLVAWMQFPDSNYKPLLSDEADLRAKLEAAERDAERYREWKRAFREGECGLWNAICDANSDAEHDAAIDASRGGERG